MNCQQADKYIYEYCDKRLSPRLTREFNEHLACCEECAALVILTRLENDALRECLADLEIDNNFTARVMASLPVAITGAAPDKHIQPARSWRRPFLYLAATAAVVLLVATATPEWIDQFNRSPIDIAEQENAPGPAALENSAAEFSVGFDQKETAIGNSQSDNLLMDSSPTADLDVKDADSAPVAVYYNEMKLTNPHLQMAMVEGSSAPPPVTISLSRDMNTLSYDSSAVQSTANPDRYRSYSVKLIPPVQNLALVPDNLPENYELTTAEDDKFVYNDKEGANQIEIFIKPYEAITEKNLAASSSAAAPAEALTATADSLPSTERLELITEYEESQYLISVEGNINREELLDLVSKVKLTPAP